MLNLTSLLLIIRSSIDAGAPFPRDVAQPDGSVLNVRVFSAMHITGARERTII
jgi:hypothetical protein